MTFEKTYKVQRNNQLIIKLPDQFKSKKVRVIVENVDETRDEKIKLMSKASKDPLFLSDIDEIAKDFENSDKDL